MYIEYSHTVVKVGQVNVNLTVEAPGSEQCFVEYVGTVCGGEYYNTAVGSESVHFSEQLVEGVLAFVVGTHIRVASASATDSVNLVNEHNTGCFFFCLTEEVAHAGGSDSDKHFHEVAAAHAEERHVCLSCHCFCKEGLACSGRSDKERTLGDFTSEVGVALRIFQKLHNFLYLCLGFGEPRHILECHLNVAVFVKYLGFAFADAEHTAVASVAAAHAAHHHEPEDNQQNHGTECPQKSGEVAVVAILDLSLEHSGLVPFVNLVLKPVG